MKIGILTFWKTEDNYGQLLQCYATQTFLRQLGHEPFLVCATNGKEYNPSLKQQIFDKLRTANRLRPYPLYLLKRASRSLFYTLSHGHLRRNIPHRGFSDFRKEYLNASAPYTLEQLNAKPPEADAFIVGSDQIWNTTDGLYFLKWAPDNVTKISIAASFGARQATPEFCHLIRPWLQRFDLVSVREKSGLEICREAGVANPHLIPDPTLLLRADDFLKIATPKKMEEPYLFIYFLGTRTAIDWKQIHTFARRKKLKIVYVGSQGQEDKFKKEEPTIPEWLTLMAHADYVITNSFHCTVFAIQFRRRFMAYPVGGSCTGMNNRLTTLLSPLGLEDHIYRGFIDTIEKEIDYNRVFDMLDIETARATELLKESLFGQQNKRCI